MKMKMHKLFFAWQHEKEEAWLNEMSARGLQLTDVCGFSYTFVEGTPGEYLYRLELLENWPTHPESVAYIHFLEGTGVEHVGSALRWAYFRKKAADGPFDLYSDVDSKLKHLGRIRLLLGVVALANTPLAILNLVNYFRERIPAVLVVDLLLILLIGLIWFGVASLSRQVRRLKKEKQYRE